MGRIDYCEHYKDEATARERKETIERSFDPRGYGTTLQVNVKVNALGSTTYVLEGYRYDSCD